MADIFDLFRQISQKSAASASPVSWLIVGLGNPGEDYKGTRHNAGFITIDALAQKLGTHIDRMKFNALTADVLIGDTKALLLKPLTFMNNSGQAVAEAASFYKIAPDHILVISDDVNLSVGRMRLRANGSAGGQNGIKSIIAHLNSDAFPRLRMGVGAKPHPDYDLADWVLSEFSKADREAINDAATAAVEGIKLLLAGQFEAAVQLCNSHGSQKKQA